MVYVIMIPPWWNHDEAGHFEYVWLVAHNSTWPDVGTFDPSLRSQIRESAQKSGEFDAFVYGFQSRADNPMFIGIPQVGELPLYYLLASIPLRLVSGSDVLVQMYVVRIFSALLTALTLYFAWQGVSEISPPKAWIVTLFLALLPGFINAMASINSDVITGLSASIFLWMSIRIMRRGFSGVNLFVWAISIVLCFYSREITRIILLFVPIIIWGRIASLRTFVVSISLGMTAIGIAAIFSLTTTDAQYWFVSPASNTPVRVADPRSPFGKMALASMPVESNFGQALPTTSVKPLRNNKVTFGFWMWADKPTNAKTPILESINRTSVRRLFQKVSISTTPQFYSVQFIVPENVEYLEVRIPFNTETVVYYDGFILTKGHFSENPPAFDDSTLSGGTWDGVAFTNIIRNPSAEQSWLNVKQSVEKFTRPIPLLRNRVSLLLATFQDWDAFGYYYPRTASWLFQTFWGRPAAAQIHLPGEFTYTILQLITFASFIGMGIMLPKVLSYPAKELIFLGLFCILVWGVVVLRGACDLLNARLIPWARYGLPAFIPTALFLCVGWQRIFKIFQVRLRAPDLGANLFSSFMITLALFAIGGIWAFFHPTGDGLQQGLLLFALILIGYQIISRIKTSFAE